jgi:O-antigen/teichoic acid export membrane protein
MGKSINHVLVFGLNLLMVRLLGAEHSGQFFNTLYVWNFLALLASCGMDFSVNHFLQRYPESKQSIFQFINRFALAIGFLVLLVMILVAKKKQDDGWLTHNGLLYFMGSFWMILWMGWLSAERRFSSINRWLIITNTIFLIFIVWQWKVFSINDGSFFLLNAYAGLTVVQSIGLWFLSRPQVKLTKVFESNLSKKMWTYGFRILLASLFYFLFLRIDLFFLQRNGDMISLSQYQQTGKLGQYFLYFAAMVGSTMLPFSNAMTLDEWKKAIQPYIMTLAIIALGIGLSGKWVFPVLFGNDFVGMELFFWILSPGFLALAFVTFMNSWLMGKGSLSIIIWADLIGCVFMIVLDALLIPSGGAMAASIISSCCYCTMAFFLWQFGMKKF